MQAGRGDVRQAGHAMVMQENFIVSMSTLTGPVLSPVPGACHPYALQSSQTPGGG